MGVVLREAPDAGEAVKLAALLVAVERGELGVAQGQVPVGVGARVEERHVARAVHRLEAVARLAVDHRGEHGVDVVL